MHGLSVRISVFWLSSCFNQTKGIKAKGKKNFSFPSKLIIKCYGHWASAEITTDNNTRSREPVKRPSNQNEHKKLTRWILVLRESVQIQVCCLFHLKEKERLHFVSISFIFKQSQFSPTSKESLHNRPFENPVEVLTFSGFYTQLLKLRSILR